MSWRLSFVSVLVFRSYPNKFKIHLFTTRCSVNVLEFFIFLYIRSCFQYKQHTIISRMTRLSSCTVTSTDLSVP